MWYIPVFAETNLNDVVDNIIEQAIPAMMENGVDPLPLPDVVEGFNITVSIIPLQLSVKKIFIISPTSSYIVYRAKPLILLYTGAANSRVWF